MAKEMALESCQGPHSCQLSSSDSLTFFKGCPKDFRISIGILQAESEKLPHMEMSLLLTLESHFFMGIQQVGNYERGGLMRPPVFDGNLPANLTKLFCLIWKEILLELPTFCLVSVQNKNGEYLCPISHEMCLNEVKRA